MNSEVILWSRIFNVEVDVARVSAIVERIGEPTSALRAVLYKHNEGFTNREYRVAATVLQSNVISRYIRSNGIANLYQLCADESRKLNNATVRQLVATNIQLLVRTIKVAIAHLKNLYTGK